MDSVWPIALGACLGLIVVAATMLIYRQESRISNRIIVQFVLTIGLPVLLLLGVPLFLFGRFIELDPRIWQALVAGVVIATGWLTTNIFTEITRQKDLAERLRDSHRAIYAEIGANLANLGGTDALSAHCDRMIERMEGDADFVPFVPVEAGSPVYEALLPGLHILPRTSIDPVVAYHALVKSIGALSQDMREPLFLNLPQERRMAVYKDYIEMKKQAFLYGDLALHLIAAYAVGGRAAAQKAERAINSPDAGRSDR